MRSNSSKEGQSKFGGQVGRVTGQVTGKSEVTGQIMQGLVDPGEDLGIYSESGGSHGGLPPEGRDLTQVLTGALWLLWGGQTFSLELVEATSSSLPFMQWNFPGPRR